MPERHITNLCPNSLFHKENSWTSEIKCLLSPETLDERRYTITLVQSTSGLNK